MLYTHTDEDPEEVRNLTILYAHGSRSYTKFVGRFFFFLPVVERRLFYYYHNNVWGVRNDVPESFNILYTTG